MKRKILFRGKREDNGEWVFGDFIENLCYDGREEEVRIGDIYFEHSGDVRGTAVYKVTPKTVGQFTGMHDKFNQRIFEGDIVVCLSLEYGYVNKEVYYAEDEAKFMLGSCGTKYEFGEYTSVEVIGNIYDNPELLETGSITNASKDTY